MRFSLDEDAASAATSEPVAVEPVTDSRGLPVGGFFLRACDASGRLLRVHDGVVVVEVKDVKIAVLVPNRSGMKMNNKGLQRATIKAHDGVNSALGLLQNSLCQRWPVKAFVDWSVPSHIGTWKSW
jgi:hypothetical protein